MDFPVHPVYYLLNLLKLDLDICHRNVWGKFDILTYSFITKPDLHKTTDGIFQVLGSGIAQSV
jgi:hypothetical protein